MDFADYKLNSVFCHILGVDYQYEISFLLPRQNFPQILCFHFNKNEKKKCVRLRPHYRSVNFNRDRNCFEV